MALFEEYYDKTPEDEKADKRPKIKRGIEKAFKKLLDSLADQKDKALDSIDDARKRLSAGQYDAVKEIDTIILTIQEIDLRVKNMEAERLEYLGE